MSDRYDVHCWCDHNKQLCRAHGLSESERCEMQRQGYAFYDRISGELLDCVHGRPANATPQLDSMETFISERTHRAHADTEPQQMMPVTSLTPWQRKHLGDAVPMREPRPSLAAAQAIYDHYYPSQSEPRSIDLAKIQKDTKRQGTEHAIEQRIKMLKAEFDAMVTEHYPPLKPLSFKMSPSTFEVRVVDTTKTVGQLMIGSDPACPEHDVYLVDSKSGSVSRITNTGGAGGGGVGGVVQSDWNNAPTPQTATKPAMSPPTDPLDVEYDGRTLRKLLEWDQAERRETTIGGLSRFTPAQRSAISAHWSAQLRAKVEAAKAKEREQVVVDRQDEP